jgi:hypothetical protein
MTCPDQTTAAPGPANPSEPRRRRHAAPNYVPPVVSEITYDSPVTESEINLVLVLLGPRIAAALDEDDV